MSECPPQALRSDLPAGAKLVLVLLWSYAGVDRRFVWPSKTCLGAGLAMTDRTLRRHIGTLRLAQWITDATNEDTRGNPGWYLCDPPGTPVHLGIEAATGEAAPRSEMAADRPILATPNRSFLAARSEMATLFGQNWPPPPYRNHQVLTTSQELTSAVQGAKTSAVGGGANPQAKLSASAFLAEFEWTWRQANENAVPLVSNPARGARRLAGLQEALDEHGESVVADVVLHAAKDTRTHLETGGRSGLDPRILAVAFRLEAPSFGVLLDRWQRDTGVRRSSGAIEAAPADVDGDSLTDEESRMWMVAGGGVHALARIRETRAAAARAAEFGADVWGET